MNRKITIVLMTCLLVVLANAEDFREAALRLTNEYRAKHGVPPLKQDPEANKAAQAYAEHLLASCQMTHSRNSKYGENLYGACGWPGPKDDAAKVKYALAGVKMWYDEVKNYNFNKPGFGMSTGHFTQIVWKGTKVQGIGLASGKMGAFMVGNYAPPGNYMGEFPANVLPASG